MRPAKTTFQASEWELPHTTTGPLTLSKAAVCWLQENTRSVCILIVGPPGFEPGTKGFTLPGIFTPAWTISSPSACAGRVREALACDQGRCSPQVVSAPSGGVPPARLRIAAGLTAAVSLNSSRCHPAITRRRHLVDESPALTVEL
jgi:hypothetical protein